MTAEKRRRLVKMLSELDDISFSNWEHEQNRLDLMEKTRAQLRIDTDIAKSGLKRPLTNG